VVHHDDRALMPADHAGEVVSMNTKSSAPGGPLRIQPAGGKCPALAVGLPIGQLRRRKPRRSHDLAGTGLVPAIFNGAIRGRTDRWRC
jgi:hypothetical protein